MSETNVLSPSRGVSRSGDLGHEHAVRGRGFVQWGLVKNSCGRGDSLVTPVHEKQRFTNTGHEDLVLVEVQAGSCSGVDGIVRLADNDGRCSS